MHDDVTGPAGFLSLNARELARTLRGDGMVRAGQLPTDVLGRVRGTTDDLPPGEYGCFHEQPDIRALVLGADVLNVVRDYFGVGTHCVRQMRDAIRPWVPDDEINARYPGRVRTIAGPAGTMFFENTEAFHRRLIFKRRRVMLNVLYASHRSWSSEGRLTPKYSDYVRRTGTR